ncbi:MAG: hypothetical protein WCT08_04380 [Patescibacteria group bacterium]|jgi:hypothetical protein
MEKIRMLERESIPCWYEAGFQTEPLAVLIRIAEEIIPTLPIISQENLMVKSFLSCKWGFKKFEPDYAGNFGFDNSLQYKGCENGFVVLECQIPRIWELTDLCCEHCKGTGKEDYFGEERKCLYCRGHGKAFKMDWQKAYAISATLSTLFSMLQFPDAETHHAIPQLMVHCFNVSRGLHGGSLGGNFSIEFTEWLLSFGHGGDIPIPEVEEAMQQVYARLFGHLDKYEKYDFRSWIRDGGLVTSCPGNACGLHPESWGSITPKHGYNYACHNVDTSAQQLTLFAGLCYLHDRARRELQSAK